MAVAQIRSLLHHVRTIAAAPDEGALTDRQLLDRYCAQKCEDAFSTLVHRHGAMVWGVCRRALGDSHAAEDAFQATFLALLQKADCTHWRESVAGWLHCAAYRIARRAKSKQREHSLPPSALGELAGDAPRDELTWREVCCILDREVRGLPERYRAPIILCYFEGKTNRDAARQLGWTKGSLSGRLARARVLLRRRLKKHGLAPSSILLCAAALQAFPPIPIVESVTRMAVNAGSRAAESIAALASPSLGSSAFGKLVVGALAAVVLIVGGIGLSGAGGELRGTPPPEKRSSPSTLTDRDDPIKLVTAPVGKTKDAAAKNLRRRMLFKSGGTQESKAAIEQGLRWLARQQQANGGWKFWNEQQGFDVAATSFALMAFFGEGHVPGKKTKESPYGKVVRLGVQYLMQRQKADGRFDGTLYVQALGATALCQAHQLTGDAKLKKAAQSAIDYVVAAQHNAGGWRYRPQQPGDTSVTIWQLTALHSAKLAELKVPHAVFTRAMRFLANCEDPAGGYGYTSPRATPTMTAVGLLGSVYLGSHPKRPRFQRGLRRLHGFGAVKNDVYHAFFATELLFHVGGEQWTKWYPALRDRLIREQKADGSWAAANDKYANSLGPVMTTSLALLILETPARAAWGLTNVSPMPADKVELERIWIDLAGTDLVAIRKGISRLAVSPKTSVPFLRNKLLSAPLNEKMKRRVVNLIADLDGRKSRQREAASKELQKLGPSVVPMLRVALKQATSLEARQRLHRLIEELDTTGGALEESRRLRAIDALELMGTPDARRLLNTLTHPAPTK